MKKKKKDAGEKVMVTMRLPRDQVRRVKFAATLLELPVQTVVSIALGEWLTEHEKTDQPILLHRYAALRKESK
jgi:hypothetical protein